MPEKQIVNSTPNDTTASYFSATCGFDFSIDEFRVFLTLLRDLSIVFSGLDINERIASSTENRALNPRQRRQALVSVLRDAIVAHGKEEDFSFIVNDDGSLHVRAYLNHFLPDGSTHFDRVKEAMTNLNDKVIDIEDRRGTWARVRLFEMPSILSYDHAHFTVNSFLVEYFIDLSRGYRRFNYDVAFNFRSVYSSRIYILLSGQTSSMPAVPIPYLKKIFGIEERYRDDRDFVRRVIQAAKKELDLKSPLTFDYKLEKRHNGKSVKFYPKKKNTNQLKQITVHGKLTKTSKEKGRPDSAV